MSWTSILQKALLSTVIVVMGACSDEQQASQPAQPAAAAAEQVTDAAAEPQSTEALVAQARTLYDQSVSLGFSWVATGKQVDAAEAALAAGEEAAAQAAAEEAIALAQASIAQAEGEAAAWQNRMPFNQPASQSNN